MAAVTDEGLQTRMQAHVGRYADKVRNEGLNDAQFMMIVGTRQPEDVQFHAA